MAIIVLNSAMKPAERVIEIPRVTVGQYTYNGKPQGPTITNLDSAHVEVRDGTKTDAGYYTLVLRLRNKDTMTWTDGSYDDITYDYSISSGKISGNVSTFQVTFDDRTSEFDVTISNLVGAIPKRAVRITSGIPDDRFSVSVIPDGEAYKLHFAITDSGKAYKEWATTIGVTILADDNHTDQSGEINVRADYVVKATFDKATDSQLVKMVKAADEGRIDLAKDCGWAVGQERDGRCPNFNANGATSGTRTFRMCLLDAGSNHSYTFANGSKPHFIVGLWFGTSESSPDETTYMFTMGNGEKNTWQDADLHTLVQSTIQGRLNGDNGYNGMFKSVTNMSVYDSSAKKTLSFSDYFAPPRAGELIGSTETYSGDGDSLYAQFAYYKEKGIGERKGTSPFGSAESYWTRTTVDTTGYSRNFYVIYETWVSNTSKSYLNGRPESNKYQLYLIGFV